jgi:WD40 repeat protein
MKSISKNIFLIIVVTLVLHTFSFAQEPVLTMTLGHVSPIGDISISPDGKYLLSRSNETIKLWDIKTGREIRNIADIKGRDISFSPDGKLFVLDGNKNTLEIRSVETSELIKTLEGKEGELCEAIFSPDGKYIASLHLDDVIVLWDIETGKIVKSFEGHTGSISMFKFSLDGNLLLSGGADYTMKLWDVATGKMLNSFDNKGKIIKAVDFSSDGKYLLAAGFDKEIKLFDAKTFKKVKTFKGHDDRILTACFSPDGKSILSGGADYKVMLWEVPTGKLVKTFDRHYHIISKVCFTPDGKQIITASWDKDILVWDVATGKTVKSLTGLFYPVSSACFSKNGEYAIISSGSYAKLWDFKHGKFIKAFQGHGHYITSCDFSSSGKQFVTGSLDKTVKLWNIMLSNELKTLSGHAKEIYSVAFSPDDKFIASGGDNMLLWNAATGEKIKDFKIGKNEVASVHFSPQGNKIFSGTGNEEFPIKMWDIEQGVELKKYPGSIQGIVSINYSPDGNYGLFCSRDGTIRVFNLESGTETITLKGNLPWNNKACFSPDSKSIATQGSDQKLVIWNFSTGELIKRFENKTGIINYISYFDDGKKLLTINDYKFAKMWDVLTGKELCTIYNLFFTDWLVVTPDGRFDGTEEAMKQLYYVKNLDFIPLESLYENYYTPKLLSKIVNNELLESATAKVSVLKPIPTIQIVSPENNSTVNQEQVKITVKATDMGGGIDEIRLYHNGKLLDGTSRGFRSVGQNHEFTVTLTDGENRIKATAFNSQRTESIPDEILVNYKAPQQVKPNMHILAVGINTYLNPKYNLNYAKNDADAFVKSLSNGASSLFGKVEVTSINDANATKTGIVAAFDRIKANAKAEDVFVFYYAGHGVMSTGTDAEKPLFYLVPHDVTKMYEADEMLKKLGISANEIGEFSKNIKAQKQLFVIDACQSGGAMQTLASRGASEEKAIAQLARSTGTYFIAASGTEQFATEVAELGHGVFTYAIIEALKGSCKSQDGRVTVNLLKSCVEDLVPELSKKHKGQPQFPTGYGFGMDFPIVIVK